MIIATSHPSFGAEPPSRRSRLSLWARLPFCTTVALFSLSTVLYGTDYQGRLTLSEIAATSDLVFAKDGINDSVAVSRSDNYVALRINGRVDASTGDERTQLLLGHLGAAFDPPPRRVLIIGFGSGMTASAVARYPDIEKIDCVEIEPAVINAAPFLISLNRNVLSDPRVHVIFDDARNFLLTTREKYDLIISEPSNPWIAGVATLFTDEFYAGARRALAPGGKFVQWLQSYSLAPADLKMVVATLAPSLRRRHLVACRGTGSASSGPKRQLEIQIRPASIPLAK